MKTSYKILLGTVAGLFTLLLAFLITLKQDIEELLSTSDTVVYKEVAADEFKKLTFSSGWDVEIWYGKEPKVEMDENLAGYKYYKPKSEDETLIFNKNPAIQDQEGKVKVRITTPVLKGIEADSGTHVRLNQFTTDSLHVVLKGGSFTGKANKLTYSSYETSGKTRLEFKGTDF